MLTGYKGRGFAKTFVYDVDWTKDDPFFVAEHLLWTVTFAHQHGKETAM